MPARMHPGPQREAVGGACSENRYTVTMAEAARCEKATTRRRGPSGCRCGRLTVPQTCDRCGDVFCERCVTYNHRGCRGIGR